MDPSSKLLLLELSSLAAAQTDENICEERMLILVHQAGPWVGNHKSTTVDQSGGINRDVTGQDSESSLTMRHVESMLAIGHFLVESRGKYMEQLLRPVLSFLQECPNLLLEGKFPLCFSETSASYFRSYLNHLATLAQVCPAAQPAISDTAVLVLEKIGASGWPDLPSEHVAGIMALLKAFVEYCPPLSGKQAQSASAALHLTSARQATEVVGTPTRSYQEPDEDVKAVEQTPSHNSCMEVGLGMLRSLVLATGPEGSGILFDSQPGASLLAVVTEEITAAQSFLKMSRRPLEAPPVSKHTAASRFLTAASAATLIPSLQEEGSGSREGLLLLMLDTADACAASPLHNTAACVELFQSIASGVVHAGTHWGDPLLRICLLRCKALIFNIATQGSPSRGSSIASSTIMTCSALLHHAWSFQRGAAVSFVLSLAACLKSPERSQEPYVATVAVRSALTTLLADIVLQVQQAELVDLLLPLLLEVLEEPLLSEQIVLAVANIAAAGSAAAFRQVARLLTWLYTSAATTVAQTVVVLSNQGVVPGQAMANALLLMAKHKHEPGVGEELLRQLLALCCDVGLMLEALPGQTAGCMVGALLPAVAEACRDVNPTEAVNEVLLKQFRALWFYIALYGLAPPVLAGPAPAASGETVNMSLQALFGPYCWSSALDAAIRLLATKTPPLLNLGRWQEEERELAALHNPGSRRGSGSQRAADAQRDALGAALRGRVPLSLLSQVSGMKATQLLSMAVLEALRMEQGGGSLFLPGDQAENPTSALVCSLKYFGEQHLQPPVFQCLSAAVMSAFNGALDVLGGMDNVQQRDAVVAAHALLLLQEPSNEVADMLLSRLRARFPQLLWSEACMGVLVAQAVSDGGPEQLRRWLLLAMLLAPATTQGLLQEKLRELTAWHHAAHATKLLPLLGALDINPGPAEVSSIPPATAAAAAAASGFVPDEMQGAPTGVLPASVLSASTKSRYVGEITGMLRWAPAFSSKVLVAQLAEALQNYELDEEAFRDAALRASALLLADGVQLAAEEHERLLRLLCWGPARVLLPHALTTGVFVWTWLLSAKPLLGPALLSHVVDAWLWTVRQGRGLFQSGSNSALRPHLAPGDPMPPHATDLGEVILAQQLWLGFLLDRLQVVHHSSPAQMAVLGRLLHCSLQHVDVLTCHPAATGTLFALLLLGLQWAAAQRESGGSASLLSARLLRDRCHRAALAWFAHSPSWHESHQKGFAASEAHMLALFVKYLAADERLESSFHGSGEAHIPTAMHPVWGTSDADLQVARTQRLRLLLQLCRHEEVRLATWARPLSAADGLRLLTPTQPWAEHVQCAWALDPRIAISMAVRFQGEGTISSTVAELVQAHVEAVRDVSEALPYFVTPAAAEMDSVVLQQLPYWAPCSITAALKLLTPPFRGHARVMAYVLRVLEGYPAQRVTPFMPQLVQALRYDHAGLVEEYLMVAARRSNLFAHILIWQLQGEEAPDEETMLALQSSKVGLAGNALWEIVPQVRQRIIDSFTSEARIAYEREFQFFDAVTSISGTLKSVPKEQRRDAIKIELKKIGKTEGDDVYMPTAPQLLVRECVPESGVPLQSAKKVPILVAFRVTPRGGGPESVFTQACIFKVGDDCRQDLLALQVISLLRDINHAVGLDLYLFPYSVLATGFERGIIEVVPNTRSRNQMGETADGGLYEIFQHEYGPAGSPKFEKARANFIVSSAGYAVASLLLQPKDRHNGNLLFDRDGHLVHIDFGFILETSPGGNMRFESAHFKLSHEMTQILDPSGVMRSEPWNQFVSLCVKGYLAARHHMDSILNVVQLMVDSGLPCFGRGDPIGNLQRRFHPELNDRDAALFMIHTCTDAYNKWTTTGYDLIQYLQQGIEK